MRAKSLRRLMAGALWLGLIAAPLQAQTLPVGAPATWPVSRILAPEARQFDFWVGEWDVNVRAIQEDLSWRDTHQAVAKIYPILNGKAVLELWDSPAIKGFSLRYFDPREDRWILWLNWPGRDQSGSSSLQGTFRHGRGDFFSTIQAPDGTETLQRYSFNDISPISLRWDDSFSSDGGRTWTRNWIMEFSRKMAVPRLAAAGGEAHTFVNGSRCGLENFRSYEFLAGRRTGVVTTDSAARRSELRGYRVLDGCAVIVFLGAADGTEAADTFAQVTWNTYANRFELLLLDADPDSPAHVLYSAGGVRQLVFTERPDSDDPLRRRIRFERDGEDVLWIEETPEGEEWREVSRGVFGPLM